MILFGYRLRLVQPSQQSASGASGLNQQQQPVVVGQQQPQQQQGQGSSNQQTAHAVPMPPDCDCRLGNIPLFQYTTEYQQQQLQHQHQHHHPQLGLSNSMPYMMAATPTAGGKLNRSVRNLLKIIYGIGKLISLFPVDIDGLIHIMVEWA
jgi:hypothetical protein